MHLIKSILSNNFLLPFKKGWKFIFIYHDISDPDKEHFSSAYSTRPKVFFEQMRVLKSVFNLVSLEELLENDSPDAIKASIVFDDGFYSVSEIAFPFLKKEKIPFTIFANKMAVQLNRLWVSDIVLKNPDFFDVLKANNYLDQVRINLFEFLANNHIFQNEICELIKGRYIKSKVFLDENDIIKLKKSGVQIGSHSCSHPVLSMLTATNLEREIEENKIYIDGMLGQDTQYFALPFGKKQHYNQLVLDTMKTKGHRFVFSSNPVGFTSSQFLVPRIGVTNESPKEILFYINRQFLKTINI